MPKKKTDRLPGNPGDRIHIHFENNADLGEVFEVTRKRVNDALSGHPGLKGKVKFTIGCDGDIFERSIRTAQVLFGYKFDRVELGKKAPQLRWVHAHGAGVGHLMPLDWLPPGAVLTNSRGIHGDKAEEYTIMALLMLNNEIPRNVSHQRFARWEQLFTDRIGSKTVLIIGVGHMGGGAAKWAKRFGLHVIGVRRSGKKHPHVDEMYRPQSLRKLLPKADFVLVTAPHTKDTHHLMGAQEIALMKRGAGLINFSRANLVDYEALRMRLEADELSAILDVFDPEPLPASSPLWRTRNLIITPHAASDDKSHYTPRTLHLVFENMERFIKGKTLRNRVSAELQY